MSVEFDRETVRGDGVTLEPDSWSPERVRFAVRAGPSGLGRMELWVADPVGVVGAGWRLTGADPAAATAALTAAGDWAFTQGAARVEVLTGAADDAVQRVAMAAGYVREGLRRGVPLGGGARDLVPFARLAGDPRGRAVRLLPDLPDGALTDGVVTLRPLTAADTEDTYRLRVLPDVYDSWMPPVRPSAAEVRRRCAESPAEWLAGGRAELTVRDAATDAYAGEITVHYQAPVLRQAMLGYGLLPEHRGKGYATRAVALVVGWLFDRVGVERVTAGTWVRNTASQRTLERAGFVREGLQRALLPGPEGERRDNVEFSLVRADLAGQDTSS